MLVFLFILNTVTLSIGTQSIMVKKEHLISLSMYGLACLQLVVTCEKGEGENLFLLNTLILYTAEEIRWVFDDNS